MNKLSWVTINTSLQAEAPICGVVSNYLYMYLNEEYILAEACIVGEIKLRQVYQDMEPEFHAWVSDYQTNQRIWVGRFKSLRDARITVELWVNEFFNEEL